DHQLHGFEINCRCAELAQDISKQDIEWAEKEQKRLGITESGYILIYGGSSQLDQAKGIKQIYPVKKWQQIIEDIQQKQPNLPIVLLEGPEDAEWAAALKQSRLELKSTAPGDIGKLAAITAGPNLLPCTDR